MPILGSQGSGAKGAPTVPVIGTASITNSTTVSLTFTAPTSKLPITSYTVTSSPSISLSTSGTTSPLTVTGSFVGGTTYTFTITATNSNGTSSESASSNSVTAAYPAVAAYVGGGLQSLGGNATSSAVRRVQFSNDSISTISATITVTSGSASLSNSGVAGYFAGGVDPNTTSINKLVYSTESTSTISPKVSVQSRQGGFSNSGTAGYYSASYNSQNSMNKLTYSNDTQSSVNWSGYTPGDGLYPGWTFANSGIAGYNAGQAGTNIIKMTFSNETWTNLSAKTYSFSSGQMMAGVANSGTAGYYAGGTSTGSNSLTTAEKLNFSNDTKSSLTGGTTLSVGRSIGVGFGNKGVAGYFALGINLYNSGNNWSILSDVDKIAFSNDTRSTFTLGTHTGYAPRAVSNEGTL